MQNIFCGYSKEPSKWDSSFENPKHMFQLIGEKIFKILHKQKSLSGPMIDETISSITHDPPLITYYPILSSLRHRSSF